MCHRFRLTLFLSQFWPLFRGSWNSIENWLESETEPPSGNLACPNLWNALYSIVTLPPPPTPVTIHLPLRPCVRRFFPKFLFSRVSEIAVFRKLGSEQVFRAFSELVPTCPDLFRLKTRLKSSDKSSECRALFTS